MTSLRRRFLLNGMKLFDLSGITAAFIFAAFLSSTRTESIAFTEVLSMRIKLGNFVIFIGYLLLCHLIFSSFELYGSRRLSSRSKEIFDIIKAASLATLIIAVATVLFQISLITPYFLLVFWLSANAIIIISRLLMRVILARLRVRGHNIRFMLIVGTNPRAIQFARKIESKPELGYRISGFVDNDYAQNGEFKDLGYPLVANFTTFPAFIRDNVVDEVIMGLPVKSLYDRASQIVSLCEEQGITVRFLSDIFNLKLGKAQAMQFEDDSLLTVSTGSIKELSAIAKRILDFLASSIFLILSAPLFALISFLIKITSPGTVFFTQDRVGLNKRRFRLYKFRTMIKGAEKKQAELEALNEAQGPVFKIHNT